MPSTDVLIPLLKQVNCKWISIKVAHWTNTFNVSGGNDKPLVAFITALKDAGIEVGGWHYTYPENPGPQGDRAEERREKLKLAHMLVDVEGEWSLPYGGPAAAKTYMGKLHVGNFWVGYCSFRYPTVWPNVPHAAFMNHEAMDGAAPQVYPIEAHNFGFQVERSHAEYKAINGKPFVPIGPTFGAIARDGSWWEPTAEDLQEFVAACQDLKVPAYGFYSLDWIIQHDRMDWLEAIANITIGDPPPPPPPVPGEGLKMIVTATLLQKRAGPGKTYADVGDLLKGDIVSIRNVAGSLHTSKAYSWGEIDPGVWACVTEGTVRYMEPYHPPAEPDGEPTLGVAYE